MSLIVHLALVFHVFIAVAVMVMVCGHYGTGPSALPHLIFQGWHTSILWRSTAKLLFPLHQQAFMLNTPMADIIMERSVNTRAVNH